jgi:hypothetical protein
MSEIRYWTQLATDQFPPSDLVQQAVDIISSDPEQHAERIREIERMEPTIVCLQNASGADPHGALRVYGEKVLPALRGARV